MSSSERPGGPVVNQDLESPILSTVEVTPITSSPSSSVTVMVGILTPTAYNPGTTVGSHQAVFHAPKNLE